MMIFLSEQLLVLLFVYLGFYFMLNVVLIKKISHKIDMRSIFEQPSAELQDILHKEQQTAYVLLGFAIVSLTFIMTSFQNNSSLVEITVIFFSLAFIFETIAAFLFRDIYSLGASIVGNSFLYGGVLAILCGFFSYFSIVMDWSLGIYLVYYGGIITFIALTLREISSSAKRIAKFSSGE